MLVPDAVRKCVAFVCYKDNSGKLKFAGTVSFFGERLIGGTLPYGYTITAKHVIERIAEKGDGKVYLRMNLRTGGVDYIEKNLADWVFHDKDDSVDVAVLDFLPSADRFEYLVFPLEGTAKDFKGDKLEFGIGDEVFITGLFRYHTGEERNLPIIRVGNIAALPEEKIQTKQFGEIDAYLIEAHSIGGLSGSPVFVHVEGERVYDSLPKEVKKLMQDYVKHTAFSWIGIVHGHWDVEIPFPDTPVLHHVKPKSINVGIAIVIPEEKVLEVIRHPKLIETKNRVIKNVRERNAPTLDHPKEKPKQDNIEEDFTQEDMENALKKAFKPTEDENETSGEEKS